jgi:ABC-type Fe3+ transport system permease subunit
MKTLFSKLAGLCAALFLLTPSWAWAAGEKATTLVVVADTRRVSSRVLRYFADIYNSDPWMFALWAAVLTALYGAFLGLVMDFIMARTGLDLKSRKLIEH